MFSVIFHNESFKKQFFKSGLQKTKRNKTKLKKYMNTKFGENLAVEVDLVLLLNTNSSYLLVDYFDINLTLNSFN